MEPAQWEKDLARAIEEFERAAAQRCGGCGKSSREIAADAVRAGVAS